MARKSRALQRGFTIVELLITLAVIGILAGIAIPGLMKAKSKAKCANVMAAVHFMRDNALQYYSDNSSWPADQVEGKVPPELIGSYLPDGYTFPFDSAYKLKWENWTGEDGNPGPVMGITIGLSVHCYDTTLSAYIGRHMITDAVLTNPDVYTFPYDRR
jgi:prepilin-type N-terminal cleavage/methylation domain-containing protein